MIKSNCHTHTTFCDGKCTAEEMAERAIELRFTSLGFSGHSPMTFHNDWAIKEEKLDDYYNTIEELKKRYKNKLEIYNGIELDSLHADVSSYDFDYVIGSVHQLVCENRIYEIDYTAQRLIECVKAEFDGDWNAMAKQYYSSVAKFITTYKCDVVGHFDLIEKFNDNNVLFDSNNREYMMIASLYLERICLECPDIVFEINTGAMFRCGNQKPYPSPFIMKQLKENNMKITITSDAHCTQALDYAFDSAADYCRSFGFTQAYILSGGTFEAVKL